jgi:hypothetical protein
MRDADVLREVERRREAIVKACRFLHTHPELAHEEHTCWMRRVRLRLSGTRTLSASCEEPIAAAKTLIDVTASLGRTRVLEGMEIHGDIEEGAGGDDRGSGGRLPRSPAGRRAAPRGGELIPGFMVSR